MIAYSKDNAPLVKDLEAEEVGEAAAFPFVSKSLCHHRRHPLCRQRPACDGRCRPLSSFSKNYLRNLE